MPKHLTAAQLAQFRSEGYVFPLRAVSADVFTLAAGAALMLVWAGIVESYISQYHKPVLPYEAKIAFGGTELSLLIYFYFFVGRKKAQRRVK